MGGVGKGAAGGGTSRGVPDAGLRQPSAGRRPVLDVAAPSTGPSHDSPTPRSQELLRTSDRIPPAHAGHSSFVPHPMRERARSRLPHRVDRGPVRVFLRVHQEQAPATAERTKGTEGQRDSHRPPDCGMPADTGEESSTVPPSAQPFRSPLSALGLRDRNHTRGMHEEKGNASPPAGRNLAALDNGPALSRCALRETSPGNETPHRDRAHRPRNHAGRVENPQRQPAPHPPARILVHAVFLLPGERHRRAYRGDGGDADRMPGRGVQTRGEHRYGFRVIETSSQNRGARRTRHAVMHVVLPRTTSPAPPSRRPGNRAPG